MEEIVNEEEVVNALMSIANSSVKLESDTAEIIDKIVEAKTSDEVKDLTNMFALNMRKKNIIRTVQVNDLMDKAVNQSSKRFTEKPDEMSNKDLIDYMKTFQAITEKSQQFAINEDGTPMIQINQQHNEVVTNNVMLDSNSKEKVLDVVQKILGMAHKTEITEEETEDTAKLNEEIVEGES